MNKFFIGWILFEVLLIVLNQFRDLLYQLFLRELWLLLL
jgi:hypothetical protein